MLLSGDSFWLYAASVKLLASPKPAIPILLQFDAPDCPMDDELEELELGSDVWLGWEAGSRMPCKAGTRYAIPESLMSRKNREKGTNNDKKSGERETGETEEDGRRRSPQAQRIYK